MSTRSWLDELRSTWILTILITKLWAILGLAHSFYLFVPEVEYIVPIESAKELVFAGQRSSGNEFTLISLQEEEFIVRTETFILSRKTKVNWVVADKFGRIVAVGYSTDSTNSKTTVVVIYEEGFLKLYPMKLFNDEEWARYLAVNSDGLIIVGGTNFKTGNWFDAFACKISFDGKLVWKKRIGGSADEWFGYVLNTSTGYLCVGATETYGSGSADFLCAFYSRSGKLFWRNVTGSSHWDQAMGAVEMSDGFFVVGWSKSFSVYPSGLLVKINHQGKTILQRVLDLGKDFIPKRILKVTKDKFVIAGELWNESSRWDPVILFVDDRGSLIEQQIFQIADDQSVEGMVIFNKYLIITGSSENEEGKQIGLFVFYPLEH